MLKKLNQLLQNHRYRNEDQSFISDKYASSLYEISLSAHLLLWLTFLFVIIAIIWANFAMLDEVTRGTGKTIPSRHIQVVQNLEGGILSDILVQEGELVDKGQVLLKLDALQFSSSFNESKLKYYELVATVARLSAQINESAIEIPEEVIQNAPEIAKAAQKLLISKKNELNANHRILEEQIRQKNQDLVELKSKARQISKSYKLLEQELQMSRPLVSEGAMSRVELLRLERSANDLKGDLTSARLSIPRLESSLHEAKSKLSELKMRFEREAIEQLNDAKSELERTTESIMALEDRVTRTRVISPVKGTIKQIKISTIGGVVQPGMDLVEIVPIEDQLLIEAEIRPADIAFLRPKQKAMVKLTAYDFSIYGGLEAELEHISADTITQKDGESYYLIRLRTKRNFLQKNGEKLNIIAGMTANVDILTGKKTVLDYLLKPILKAKEHALRER